MTKSAGLSSIGGGNSSEKFLGKMDKDFEFAHAAPLKVSLSFFTPVSSVLQVDDIIFVQSSLISCMF